MSEADQVFVATGRRKRAISRVRLVPGGTGKFTVNGRDLETHCYTESLSRVAAGPLVTVDRKGQFDVIVKVTGGGPNGQSEAIAHGLGRALEKFDPELRQALKKAGHLKRDPRRRERKKAGQPGARKKFQFSKR
ncbi:MAG: 30S ribosomal protein S9 [Verrucomicrobia bacterium]|jgi:small subunit ribosomal protein S9|nr:30S ribosomal protein S9 [Verrucomicrobiota bacterium]